MSQEAGRDGTNKRRRAEHDYSNLEALSDNEDEENNINPIQADDAHLNPLIEAAAARNKKRNTNKGSTRSSVWDHVKQTKVSIDGSDNVLVECKYCTKLQQYGKGTSNIWRHFKVHHPKIHGEILGTSSVDATATPTNTEKVFRDDIVQLILEENQPLVFCESKSFRQLLQHQGVSFTVSAATIKTLIELKVRESNDELRNTLDTTCEAAASIIDAWTSPNQMGFVAIMILWLTPNMELKQRLIEFDTIDGHHSGFNLSVKLTNALQRYNLVEKLVSITADNASNNKSLNDQMFNTLQQKLQQGHQLLIKFQGTHSFVRCLAHIINLLVKDILAALKCGDYEDANNVIDKIEENNQMTTISVVLKLRSLILHVRRSTLRRQNWDVLVPADQQKRNIQLDMKVRWNSTFNMIDDALRFPREIKLYTQQYVPELAFTNEDWELLNDLNKCLKPFKDMTDSLSASTPQILNALPVYYALHDLLHDVSEKKKGFKDINNDVTDAFKQAIEKYNKYYSLMDRSLTYYIAATLDPRFKSVWMKNQLTEEGYNTIVADIIEKIKADFDVRNNDVEQTPPSSEYSVRSFMQRCMAESNYKNDVDRYYESDVIHAKVVKDTSSFEFAVKWWRDNQSEYPVMSRVARHYLAIPSTSVNVERLFNVGRDVLQIRRQNMSAELFRQTMLLKDHYRDKQ